MSERDRVTFVFAVAVLAILVMLYVSTITPPYHPAGAMPGLTPDGGLPK